MMRIAPACIFAFTALAVLPAPAALAQEAGPAREIAYLDDRSSPGALVRSLYNAIERGEFARAWSYFAEPPAASVEAYAEGYADTEHIELVVGAPNEEGAAGSVYFELPVALRAEAGDGSSQVFSGCYTLRMADTTAGETFDPLIIEHGTLRPSDSDIANALPRRCADDGRDFPEYDAALEKVKAIYANLDRCIAARMPFTEPAELEPEVHEIAFRYAFDADDQAERVAKLYRVLCYRAAYNEGHVYFLTSDDGEVAPLHFARPGLDIRYAGENDEELESMTVIGFSTYDVLVNSQYDADTRTVTSFSRWRGMADASSAGRWVFREGRFDLIHYEVDPTYDGEVNPQVVVDYDEAP